MDYKKYFNEGIIAEWYLRHDQLRLYDMLQDKKKVVVNTHRRWGKSTTVFTYIFERCLTEKIIVRCGGQTQKSFRDIFSTVVDSIFENAPQMKPKYNSEDGCWVFKTGSRIYLFGCSDKAEADKSRGALAHIIYCDEYGFWAYKARYYLTSALSPQLDTTDGQLIITSTPPEDLTHDYLDQVNEAERGVYYFLQDLPRSIAEGTVTDSMHEKIILRCGGIESDAYQREYLCLFIAPSQRLVIPEANDLSFVFDDYKRPPHYHAYSFMDLGLKDFTANLWGWYDFEHRCLVVEDELVTNYKTTEEIVELSRKKEERLAFPTIDRISDSEMQQLYDMNNTYKYRVRAVVKRTEESDTGYKESIINGVRIAMRGRRIKVHSRCKNLISQLRFGIWKENRTDFERTETMGHLDAVMALCYGWDYIDKKKNPFPTALEQIREESKKPDMQVNWRAKLKDAVRDFMEKAPKQKTYKKY